MRKRLKGIIIAAGVFTSLAIVSCAPDRPPTAPTRMDPAVARQRLQMIQEKYGWVGKYHTDGLGFIYARLAKGGARPRSHSELCRSAAQAAKDFHRSQRRNEVPATLVDPSLNDEVCPSAGGPAVSNSVQALPGSRSAHRDELSSTASAYIDQITNLAGTATSAYALTSGVNNIELAAMNLPEDEAGAVVAIGSVAISSDVYWEANLSSWLNLAGPQSQYAVTVRDMTAMSVGSVAAGAFGRRYSIRWWNNPFVVGFQKVLAADALAGARVIYTAWEIGPLVLDAAAQAALWASSVAALTLLFFSP